MTPRLSGHFSTFHPVVWISLCSSLFWELRDNGVVKNLQFCPFKPRSHNRILTYRTWAINASLVLSYAADFSKMQPNIVFSHNLVARFSILPVS